MLRQIRNHSHYFINLTLNIYQYSNLTKSQKLANKADTNATKRNQNQTKNAKQFPQQTHYSEHYLYNYADTKQRESDKHSSQQRNAFTTQKSNITTQTS